MQRIVIEKEFEHMGYRCVITLNYMGFRCGYVGIPKTNTLYNKSGRDYLEIKKADIEDREISGVFQLLSCCLDEDERVPIDAYFQVHGGITYASSGENVHFTDENDLWWFGFDCDHCDDRKDFAAVDATWDMTAKNKLEKELIKAAKVMRRLDKLHPIGEIRTVDYVMDQCKLLAEQLKEFEYNIM